VKEVLAQDLTGGSCKRRFGISFGRELPAFDLKVNRPRKRKQANKPPCREETKCRSPRLSPTANPRELRARA